MSQSIENGIQKSVRNDLVAVNIPHDNLAAWFEAYLKLADNTLPATQKAKRRDIRLFLAFMQQEEQTLERPRWIRSLSRDFKAALIREKKTDGTRRWSDRTINRMLVHLSQFAKWLHKTTPFPFDNPMDGIKPIPLKTLLDIERAITSSDRRRLLDAADYLILAGGRSRDRHRHRDPSKRPPQRKGYRPYRNRAIVYTLVETGMRLSAITNIDLPNVDFKAREVQTLEKGAHMAKYVLSRKAMRAIRDYLEHERELDSDVFNSPALFLPARTRAKIKRTARSKNAPRLHPNSIGRIWNSIRDMAGVDKSKTPHCARHGVGKHVMEQTGNAAAVARALNQKNMTYALQYSRITKQELVCVLDDRDGSDE